MVYKLFRNKPISYGIIEGDKDYEYSITLDNGQYTATLEGPLTEEKLFDSSFSSLMNTMEKDYGKVISNYMNIIQ